MSLADKTQELVSEIATAIGTVLEGCEDRIDALSEDYGKLTIQLIQTNQQNLANGALQASLTLQQMVGNIKGSLNPAVQAAQQIAQVEAAAKTSSRS